MANTILFIIDRRTYGNTLSINEIASDTACTVVFTYAAKARAHTLKATPEGRIDIECYEIIALCLTHTCSI